MVCWHAYEQAKKRIDFRDTLRSADQKPTFPVGSSLDSREHRGISLPKNGPQQSSFNFCCPSNRISSDSSCDPGSPREVTLKKVVARISGSSESRIQSCCPGNTVFELNRPRIRDLRLKKLLPSPSLKNYKKKCSFDLTQTDKQTNNFVSQDPPFSRGNNKEYFT